MTTYSGIPHEGAGKCTVLIDGAIPLGPRYDLANHSPDGFQWGYGGSGPAQLALALCAHALKDDERARRVYQRFKFRTVGGWPMGKAWSITDTDIISIAETIERERATP